jgi:hypothetical protein
LPKHPLRNGRLNQTAYSLFLFIRDIADGDLVAWIDRQLAEPDDRTSINAYRGDDGHIREAIAKRKYKFSIPGCRPDISKRPDGCCVSVKRSTALPHSVK